MGLAWVHGVSMGAWGSSMEEHGCMGLAWVHGAAAWRSMGAWGSSMEEHGCMGQQHGGAWVHRATWVHGSCMGVWGS